MSTEIVQTLVNAVLLLVVAFIGGSLGLRRFEAIEGSIADLRTEMKSDDAELRRELIGDIAELRTDVKSEIAQLRVEGGQIRGELGQLRGELGQLRGEFAQMRSDVTHIAFAVGARPAEGSG